MDSYFDTFLTQLFGNTAIDSVKCILFANYLEECGDSTMSVFGAILRHDQVFRKSFYSLSRKLFER